VNEDKDNILSRVMKGLRFRVYKKMLKDDGDNEKGTLGNEGTRDWGMLRRWQEC
jgi:hypothetical protein